MHLLMEITTFISIKRCINYWQDYKKTVLPSLMMILIGFGHFLSVLRPEAHSAWNHMIFSIKAWNSVSSTTESGELLLDIDLWPLIFFSLCHSVSRALFTGLLFQNICNFEKQLHNSMQTPKVIMLRKKTTTTYFWIL